MYKQFKTDESLEKTGIWIDYGTFRVKCARSGGSNVRWQKILDKLTKPYKRQMEGGNLPEAKGQEILRVAFARSVILAWEVAVDKDGKAIEDDDQLPSDETTRKWKAGLHSPEGEGKIVPFSEDNVCAAFKALGDLFADIRQQTGTAALYKEDILEAEAGN